MWFTTVQILFQRILRFFGVMRIRKRCFFLLLVILISISGKSRPYPAFNGRHINFLSLFDDGLLLLGAATTSSNTTISADKTASITLSIISNRLAVPIIVGSNKQSLMVGLQTMSEGIYLFDVNSAICKDSPAKEKRNAGNEYERKCYDPTQSTSAEWCSSKDNVACEMSDPPFVCTAVNNYDPLTAVEYKTTYFDGVIFPHYHIEGSETVLFQFGESAETAFEGKIPVKSVTNATQYDKWPSFNVLDGILGVAGPEFCCRSKSLWNQILTENSWTQFALDVQVSLPTNNKVAPADHGIIHLGDFPHPYSILWSERKQTGQYDVDALYRFTMYHPRMCDTYISSDISSNWEVEIDTGSSCLVLPPPLFERVFAWLPSDSSNCTSTDENDIEIAPYVCELYANSTGILPTLSFDLDQLSTQTVHLSLTDLVFSNADTDKQSLCIAKTNITDNPAYTDRSKTIKFGLSVLSQLYVVADIGNSKIGLAQKSDPVGNDSECSPRPTCIGQQSYNPALNKCNDPYCSNYIMMTVDSTTKNCVLASYVVPLVFSFLALLAALDLGSFFLNRRIVRAAEISCK